MLLGFEIVIEGTHTHISAISEILNGNFVMTSLTNQTASSVE